MNIVDLNSLNYYVKNINPDILEDMIDGNVEMDQVVCTYIASLSTETYFPETYKEMKEIYEWACAQDYTVAKASSHTYLYGNEMPNHPGVYDHNTYYSMRSGDYMVVLTEQQLEDLGIG